MTSRATTPFPAAAPLPRPARRESLKVFIREIWLRTQHERTFRRLRVYDVAVGEIGFWTPDDYVNPHARD